MKKILYAAIGAAVAAAIFMVTAFADNDTVATVGNTEITKEALYEELVKANGSATLETMISDEVIRQEAEKTDIEVTQEEIDAEITVYEEQYGGKEGLEEALATSGMTVADLEKEAETYLTIKKLIEPEIEITDEEISTYFEENKESLGEAAQVEASHILVETEEAANEVKTKLADGGDFAELAKEYSVDTVSAENGGELGSFGAGEMVAEFDEAAFGMEVDEVSEPVKTDYGYHIIKVTGKTDAVEATLEDSKEEIRTILFDEALNTQYATWMAEITASYKIENTLTE